MRFYGFSLGNDLGYCLIKYGKLTDLNKFVIYNPYILETLKSTGSIPGVTAEKEIPVATLKFKKINLPEELYGSDDSDYRSFFPEIRPSDVRKLRLGVYSGPRFIDEGHIPAGVQFWTQKPVKPSGFFNKLINYIFPRYERDEARIILGIKSKTNLVKNLLQKDPDKALKAMALEDRAGYVHELIHVLTGAVDRPLTTLIDDVSVPKNKRYEFNYFFDPVEVDSFMAEGLYMYMLNKGKLPRNEKEAKEVFELIRKNSTGVLEKIYNYYDKYLRGDKKQYFYRRMVELSRLLESLRAVGYI